MSPTHPWSGRWPALLLRVLLVAVVVGVLAGRVQWHDALVLEGPPRAELVGRVERLEGGDFRVRPVGEAWRAVSAGEVARRRAAEPAAPDAPPDALPGGAPEVAWGLATLGRRLLGRPGTLLLVLAFLLALTALTAWRWWLLARALHLELSLPRALRLGFIGAFFNLAVPGSTGGDVVKAWYAARHTARGTRAVVSVFIDRFLGLVGLAALAGAVLLLVPEIAQRAPAGRLIAAVLLGGLVLAFLLLEPRLRRLLGLTRLLGRLPGRTLLAEGAEAMRLYRARPGVLLGGLGISVLNHAAAALAVWLLARALGVGGIGPWTALALVPVANLLAAIPLLPGGWGVGELAFAWLFGAMGVPATEAVGLSLVYRLGLLVASLPGGALWIFWKGRPTRESIRRRVAEAERALPPLEGVPLGGTRVPDREAT